MALAILCSGQGWQSPAMFELTGSLPVAEHLFRNARYLFEHHDPRDLVKELDANGLHQNRTAQILCVLQALAAMAGLRRYFPDRIIIAGYSVGEMAAWGAAGLIDMPQCIALTAARAEVMDAVGASDDGLISVRGLSRNTVETLCRENDTAIAIVNPEQSFVVGGSRTALNSFEARVRGFGATSLVSLPVHVASHTGRLSEATTKFRERLSGIHIRASWASRVRVISGIDGTPITRVEDGLEKLARQISETVLWESCLESCVESGATAFLELGPGTALSRMASQICRPGYARSIDEFRSLDAIGEWLKQRA